MRIWIMALILLTAASAWAECNPVTCLMRGGSCVNGECVIGGTVPQPTQTPVPTPAIVPHDFTVLMTGKFFCNSKSCIVIFDAPTPATTPEP